MRPRGRAHRDRRAEPQGRRRRPPGREGAGRTDVQLMDPTTSIPIHLTTETVVLAACGLVLAWSVLRRMWIASASALALLVVQSLHAGQFIENEDDPWLLAFRLAGLVGLAVSVLPTDIGRPLF